MNILDVFSALDGPIELIPFALYQVNQDKFRVPTTYESDPPPTPLCETKFREKESIVAPYTEWFKIWGVTELFFVNMFF